MSEMIAFGARHADPRPARERERAEEPALDRLEELLLAAGAGEVRLLGRAAVLADPHDVERLLAVEVVLALAEAHACGPRSATRCSCSNVMFTPPSASTNFGKPLKSTSTMWLTSMPRNCLIVSIISGGPPIA